MSNSPETSKNTSYAMWIHLSTYVWMFMPFIGIIIPIVMWSSKKDEDPFVDHHGREVIRLQIMMMVWSFAIFFATLLLYVPLMAISMATADAGGAGMEISSGFGIVLLLSVLAYIFAMIAFSIYTLIMPLIGAIQANDGLPYAYPLIFSGRRKVYKAWKREESPTRHQEY